MPDPIRIPRLLCALMLASSCLAAGPIDSRADDDEVYRVQRLEMIRAIQHHADMASSETGVAEIDPQILEVMAEIPRHEFVPEALRGLAYADTPLPIGQGQNLAMPFLVALMTHLAAIEPDDIVFETGTGAGYHAAVLSRLARQVVSVEVVAPLALQAADTLKRLGHANVTVISGDGYYGAPRHGPFDAVIVKEAVDHVPPRLFAQIKPGGRMVLPLGPRRGPQMLTVIEKDADGQPRRRAVLAVRFTPLQGGERI